MKPKYSAGTKVKIKARNAGGQLVYPEVAGYENKSGIVLDSKAIIAYNTGFILFEYKSIDVRPSTLYMYTVELEEGTKLNDLMEYYLEAI